MTTRLLLFSVHVTVSYLPEVFKSKKQILRRRNIWSVLFPLSCCHVVFQSPVLSKRGRQQKSVNSILIKKSIFCLFKTERSPFIFSCKNKYLQYYVNIASFITCNIHADASVLKSFFCFFLWILRSFFLSLTIGFDSGFTSCISTGFSSAGVSKTTSVGSSSISTLLPVFLSFCTSFTCCFSLNLAATDNLTSRRCYKSKN